MYYRFLILMLLALSTDIFCSQVPALRLWQPHVCLALIIFAAQGFSFTFLLWLAFLTGLTQDFFTGSPFGLQSLSLVVIAVISYRYRHHFYVNSRLNVFAFVLLLSLLETALLGAVIDGPGGAIRGVDFRGGLITAFIAVINPKWVMQAIPRKKISMPH